MSGTALAFTRLTLPQPSFLTVFQYHYAGRPALSALRSHSYIPRYFNPTNAGLPGNDDSGAMGSFVAMSMCVVLSPSKKLSMELTCT
jgi:putative alpha-1,2-mannosidase